jgi:hypothetical protein
MSRNSAQARLHTQHVSTGLVWHSRLSGWKESLLETQTHTWAAREGHQPVFKIDRLEPALRDELVWLRENCAIIVDKGAAARDDRL